MSTSTIRVEYANMLEWYINCNEDIVTMICIQGSDKISSKFQSNFLPNNHIIKFVKQFLSRSNLSEKGRNKPQRLMKTNLVSVSRSK